MFSLVHFRSCSSSAAHVVSKGRFQHWRRPVYQAPHQNVLDVGPDFSFSNERRVHVTSQKELDFKLDQLRLGKKIVSLLEDVKRMQDVHSTFERNRAVKLQEQERFTPLKKGMESIR